MTLRGWVTLLVIGTFLALGVAGALIFLHLDVGLNKLLHEWTGLVMNAAVRAHVALNWRAFFAGFRGPLTRPIMALGVDLPRLYFASLPEMGGGPGASVGKVVAALGGARGVDRRA